jgi:hypothetical protein
VRKLENDEAPWREMPRADALALAALVEGKRA